MLFITALLLTGCGGIPVPEDKKEYIGVWAGQDVLLEIKENGDVSYAKRIGDYTETVDSPLQEFDGDNFSIGYGFVSQSFEVSQPPFEDETGQWKMVLDGVTLTRLEED